MLRGHLDVLVGHGGRDPDRVAVVHQPRQRGDEPAAAAPRLAVPRTWPGRGSRRGRGRSPWFICASWKILSQSRSRRGVRKCCAHVLLARAPEPLAEVGLAQDAQRALGALLGRGDEEAGLAVLHLERDAADVAADERAALPERLRHRQAEALARGLLDHHVGLRLEGVHLDRADAVQVVEDVDVRVAVRVGHRRVEELPALRVVGGHRAHQRELHLGHLLRDHPVRVDHAHRILPGVEARHLAHQRAVHVDAELVADEGGVLRRERHVLRRQRVDRRRADARRRRSRRPSAAGTYCGRCQTDAS